MCELVLYSGQLSFVRLNTNEAGMQKSDIEVVPVILVNGNETDPTLCDDSQEGK